MDERSYREILQRRQDLMEELRAVEDIIQAYERLQRLRTANAAHEAHSLRDEGGTLKRERNIFPPRRLADFARVEILKRGRPMTRGELVDAFASAGIPLAGTDKAKNIGTIMWRFRDEFLNVPGRGYWPQDMPNPELNLLPRDDKSDD